MISTFRTNRIVKCYKSDDLTKPFVGKISNIANDYAIIDILDYDPSDRHVAYQIDYTTRVKISDIVPLEVRHHNS